MFDITCLIAASIITIIIAAISLKIMMGFMESAELGIIVSIIIFLIICFASFMLSAYIVNKITDPYDYTTSYITTKQDLPIYEKITKNPYGTQTGTLKTDSVMKVQKAKRKKLLTWIEGYVLEEGKAKYTTILIPEKIQIKQNCSYFDYNEKSASFKAYYESIDAQNEHILEKIQKDFSAELGQNDIKVEYSANNVLRESIKETHYILSSNGFFKLYEAKNNNDFYYIEKKDKKKFKKIVKAYNKRLKKETIPYFEPRRK